MKAVMANRSIYCKMSLVVAVVTVVLQMSQKGCICSRSVAYVPYAVLQMYQECCICPLCSVANVPYGCKCTRNVAYVTYFVLQMVP